MLWLRVQALDNSKFSDPHARLLAMSLRRQKIVGRSIRLPTSSDPPDASGVGDMLETVNGKTAASGAAGWRSSATPQTACGA